MLFAISSLCHSVSHSDHLLSQSREETAHPLAYNCFPGFASSRSDIFLAPAFLLDDLHNELRVLTSVLLALQSIRNGRT